MPEYTVSLLIWIVPVIFLAIRFKVKKLLNHPKIVSLLITSGIITVIGFILDLWLAPVFFTFPHEEQMCIGWKLHGIPIEEFIFYITGNWFIIMLYAWFDEEVLKAYNKPDAKYTRIHSLLGKRDKWKRFLFPSLKGIPVFIVLFIAGIVTQRIMNPETNWLIPGYYTFLLVCAYIPFMLFSRITRSYTNWRAFWFSMVTILLCSIIWEVTLAIPRGYWGYQTEPMLGIFLPAWSSPLSQFPLEAVTVWIFCTLNILLYEWGKITFFTKDTKE